MFLLYIFLVTRFIDKEKKRGTNGRERERKKNLFYYHHNFHFQKLFIIHETQYFWL